MTSPDQCHPSLQENRGGKALKELQKNSVSGVGMKQIQLHHAAFKATSLNHSGWRTGNKDSLPSYSADVQSRLVSSFLKLPQSPKTDFLYDQGSFLIDSVNKMSGNISPDSKAVNYPCHTAFQYLLHFLSLFRILIFFKKMLITLIYP